MKISNVEIEVVRGSACDIAGDILVNAANTGMRGGFGLDGEIHRRCGSELVSELVEKAPNGANTAEPVVTRAYEELSHVKHIIHIAGPIWDGTDQTLKCQQLRECYRNCIEKAIKLDVQSIVFPSISTGVYGFPLELAAEIALNAVVDRLKVLSLVYKLSYRPPINLERVTFAMFKQEEYYVFSEELEKISSKEKE